MKAPREFSKRELLTRGNVLCVGPFWRSFPGNEAHKLFSGGQNWGVLAGGQKVYVENIYVLFPSPKGVRVPIGALGVGFRWVVGARFSGGN